MLLVIAPNADRYTHIVLMTQMPGEHRSDVVF